MDELIRKAAGDLISAHYAIALTGAGISTESGIPDFRGPSGVWTLNPEAEKKAFMGYDDFIADPKAWWNSMLTVKQDDGIHVLTNLDHAEPNAGHYALAALEKMGILKSTITQNIDSLHERAGTKRLYEYHGSTSKLRCLVCGTRYRRDAFDLEKLKEEDKLPPVCPKCGGIIKSDGVFFGEPIPGDVADASLMEAMKCDLMLICGTSAVVYPFANLPRVARQKEITTIIEINAEPTPLTEEGISDYLIQGNTGDILPRLVEEIRRLRY